MHAHMTCISITYWEFKEFSENLVDIIPGPLGRLWDCTELLQAVCGRGTHRAHS